RGDHQPTPLRSGSYNAVQLVTLANPTALRRIASASAVSTFPLALTSQTLFAHATRSTAARSASSASDAVSSQSEFASPHKGSTDVVATVQPHAAPMPS